MTKILHFTDESGERACLYLEGEHKGKVGCSPVDGFFTDKRNATVNELCDLLSFAHDRFPIIDAAGVVIDPLK